MRKKERMMYDYRESLSRLSERVQKMRQADGSPTAERRELTDLAADLDRVAERLQAGAFIWLQQAFDRDQRAEIGLDGWPASPDESRANRFAGLRLQIMELAECAKREAESLPDARRRGYLDYCADAFLHIRNECEMPHAVLYDKSEAVADFSAVLNAAGIVLSPERVRGLLAEAQKRFHAFEIPDGLLQLLVVRR